MAEPPQSLSGQSEAFRDRDPDTPGLLDEKLGRLAKKPGVRATLVLDRTSGALLKTSGDVATLGVAAAPLTATPPTPPMDAAGAAVAAGNALGGGSALERYASIVWRFVVASGGLLHELNSEDELKLLRMRTKKQELVIVPDSKYLLVVVHDTPAA